MRDLTVLRQVAAHLDGWAGLRAWVETEGVAWPCVVAEQGIRPSVIHWRCVKDTWEGWVLRHGNPHPVAVVQTTIAEAEGAGDVALAIKELYQDLRVYPD